MRFKPFAPIGYIVSFLILHCATAAFADIDNPVFLNVDQFLGEDKAVILSENWRYHAGDDLSWADPSYDDNTWEPVDTRLFIDRLPKNGWTGIGWFRCHIKVDASLWHRPLALNMYHPGASEVFVNGKLCYQFGKVGNDRESEEPYSENNPRVILLENQSDIVIAVRYSNFSVSFFKHVSLPMGFSIVLSDLNQRIVSRSNWIRSTTGYQMFFGGIPITFAILHLFIFIYYPRIKVNLYFAIFTACISTFIFSNFQGRFLTDAVFNPAVSNLGRTSVEIFYFVILWRISAILSMLSGLLFLYALFYERQPKQFWCFVGIGIVLGGWSIINPIGGWNIFNVYLLIAVLEIVRVLVTAIMQNKDGAKLIGIGSLALMVGTVYLILRNLDTFPDIPNFNNSFYYGILMLLFFMSLHLSRDFAKTRLDLEKHQVQTRDLSQVNLELRKNQAIEQVRMEAIAMQESHDIVRVVAAVWEGLKTCRLSFEAISIAIRIPNKRQLQFYGAVDLAGDLVSLLNDPDQHLFQKNVVEGVHLWRNEIALSKALGLKAQPGVHQADEYFKTYLKLLWETFDPPHWLMERTIIEVHFSHGYLSLLGTPQTVFGDSDFQVTTAFAEAISLGYARFFDLKVIEETQQRMIAEMEDELQTAHKIQMSLMPKSSPQLTGLDVAGRCVPANHVCGDFFQFFQKSGKFTIALADVTGHAMEAAIPVVLFSGVLKGYMELDITIQECFERLNRAMCDTLPKRTFVCFLMGELDLNTHLFTLSDSGCPYPYHFNFRSQKLSEIPIDAYPLGVRPDTAYVTSEIQLQPGDYMIFCSDGLIEAINTAGDLFGFQRVSETIQNACKTNLPANLNNSQTE